MFDNSGCYSKMTDLGLVLDSYPDGIAEIRGSKQYEEIFGKVRFYQTAKGVLVAAEVNGLPYSTQECESRIFALHIHEGESCTGNEADSFADAMMHYNPKQCEHPYHAGDLVPILGSKGYGLVVFVTDRFTVKEIEGKTIIIHSGADDFKTQPSGASGEKIACGRIKLCRASHT